MSHPDQIDSSRARIYDNYVTGRIGVAVPESRASTTKNMHYFGMLVRKHFPMDRDSSISDLACDYGLLIHALHEAGCGNVRIVDGSYEQVQAAHWLVIDGVEHGEMHDVLKRTPSTSVDALICFDVMEHFTKGEFLGLLDSARRILKSGGRWPIHVPNAECPFSCRIHYGDYIHKHALTRESLAQLLLSGASQASVALRTAQRCMAFKSAVRALLWRWLPVSLLFYIAGETRALNGSGLFSQNLPAVAFQN